MYSTPHCTVCYADTDVIIHTKINVVICKFISLLLVFILTLSLPEMVTFKYLGVAKGHTQQLLKERVFSEVSKDTTLSS